MITGMILANYSESWGGEKRSVKPGGEASELDLPDGEQFPLEGRRGKYF